MDTWVVVAALKDQAKQLILRRERLMCMCVTLMSVVFLKSKSTHCTLLALSRYVSSLSLHRAVVHLRGRPGWQWVSSRVGRPLTTGRFDSWLLRSTCRSVLGQYSEPQIAKSRCSGLGQHLRRCHCTQETSLKRSPKVRKTEN